MLRTRFIDAHSVLQLIIDCTDVARMIFYLLLVNFGFLFGWVWHHLLFVMDKSQWMVSRIRRMSWQKRAKWQRMQWSFVDTEKLGRNL